MKHGKKLTLNLFFILLILTISFSGCSSDINSIIPIPNIVTLPLSGTISIENGSDSTFDRTPELTISSDGADYMSFSGDAENWSEWVEYDTFYKDFNMVNSLNGTQFISGLKYIYVRFKDDNGKLSLSNNLAYDTINYEFKKLNSIKIIPSDITMKTGSQYTFEVKGYDIDSNEVPLSGSEIIWEKCCGVGSLSNTSGLTTTYTAPTVSGERDITATSGPLRVKATIMVIR